MTISRAAALADMLRPLAHRGLHVPRSERIENTATAFSAAIAAGVGIECDVQATRDGNAVVFHDETLERLTGETGPVVDRTIDELTRICYPGTGDRILTLDALLDITRGQVPLFVEIKSDWSQPNLDVIRAICHQLTAYRGAAAIMSFDPAVLSAVRELAPGLLRGIVACRYTAADWPDAALDQERRDRLSHLLENDAAEPDFVNYRVGDLPTPVTRYIREVQRLPLLTWTVRDTATLKAATRWADAPVFEMLSPADVWAAMNAQRGS
ncbi:MAG: glycerophosphodiester phosphodiesterase family protein [Pseudomonadota bacterium]